MPSFTNLFFAVSLSFLEYRQLVWSVEIVKLAHRARTQITHRFPADATQIPCGAGRRDTAAVIDIYISIRVTVQPPYLKFNWLVCSVGIGLSFKKGIDIYLSIQQDSGTFLSRILSTTFETR